MEKTKIEILNDALNILHTTTTWKDFRDNMKGVSKENRRTIIRKLQRDGYVDVLNGAILIPTTDEAGYRDEFLIQRNFEGDLFMEQGGYIQQKINNDLENDRIRKLENNQDRQATRMTRLTMWVAIGAVGLVVWEIIKFFIFEHPKSCSP